jgi:hypothetical protein
MLEPCEFKVGDRIKVKDSMLDAWRKKLRPNCLLRIAKIVPRYAGNGYCIYPTKETSVTGKDNNPAYWDSWFELFDKKDSDSAPDPLFKAGDIVNVKPKLIAAAISGFSLKSTENLHIEEWSRYNGHSHTYKIKEYTIGTGTLGEGWFEPIVKLDLKLDFEAKLDNEDNESNDEVGYQTITNPHRRLVVHVCLWCNEPITRCEKGEYKGHWEHMDRQVPSINNRWICSTFRTKDKAPHICALNTAYNLMQGSTAEIHDTKIIFPTTRKFKLTN